VLYVTIGLVAGLAVGLGLVIVMALVSDRLRRRDDIAYALGGPVGLSTGRIHLSRWRPGQRGLAAASGRDMQRIVAYLRGIAPAGSRGTALAIVPVDNARIAALSLVSLAVTGAREGKQVVIADLCSGAPAGRLLGAGHPGIHAVSADGMDLTIVIPHPDDIIPIGPLHRTSPQAHPALDAEALAGACASADLLLTLVDLDPALGAEHLATWATDAVAVVTAGRSSATRIHAVGEMTRLAGTNLVSAVLIGADPADESLGITAPPPPVPAGPISPKVPPALDRNGTRPSGAMS
jgi:hypothetical protein